MQTALRICSAMLLGAMFHLAAASQTPPEMLLRQATSVTKDARISGMAMVKIDAGAIAWHENIGRRDAENTVNADTVFNAASLTKPVFAALVLQLVARDQLTLDEPLAQYWVDPDIAADPRHTALTARLVLSHQTGLPNWRGNKALHFMFAPGSRHEYSGEGFEYLRRAIERKLGKDVAALTQQYVFAPAGMTSSAMGWHASLAANLASGFNEQMQVIDTALAAKQPNAAAHLMTTAQDYARFLMWIANGAGLPAALYQDMLTPQAQHATPVERFGLGWKLVPLNGAEVLLHDGREPGVRSYAVINPQNKEGMVMLTNSANGDLAFRPISRQALSYGDLLWQSTDQLVWHYLNSLPEQALGPMTQAIARSPAYLITFLHAANTQLVQHADVPQALKAKAKAAILPLALRLLHAELAPAQTAELIGRLILAENGSVALVQRFNAAQATDWVNQLARLSQE